MRINEYLQLRNITTVTTGKVGSDVNVGTKQNVSPENSDFAKELRAQLEQNDGVSFSKHALERLSERQIDISSDDTLERLNKAVKLADEKGANDALVMIDSNAFIVSVKNNKVITTMSADDSRENIFTGIDSAIIM